MHLNLSTHPAKIKVKTNNYVYCGWDAVFYYN